MSSRGCQTEAVEKPLLDALPLGGSGARVPGGGPRGRRRRRRPAPSLRRRAALGPRLARRVGAPDAARPGPPGGRSRGQRHRRPGLRDALRPRQPGLARRPVRARTARRGLRAGRRPPDPRRGRRRRGGLRAGHRATGRVPAPLPRLRPRGRRGRADEGGLGRGPPLLHGAGGDGDGVDRRGRRAPRPRRLRRHGAPARGQRPRVRRAGPSLPPPDRAARRLEGLGRRDHRGRGGHRAAGARPRVGAAARRRRRSSCAAAT